MAHYQMKANQNGSVLTSGRKFILPLLILTILILQAVLVIRFAPVEGAVSQNVVISQVYGAGGNSGAVFQNDYVELFNRGTAAVSVDGYSIQYASATGTGNFSSNAVTVLSGTIDPGQYYLVKLAGGTTGSPLTGEDASGTVNLSGTSGKVVLVNNSNGLACNGGSTACSSAQLAQIIDLVGFGSANFFEGTAAAPAPSASNAIFRGGGGCTDTDQNNSDFTAAAANPRNSSSALNQCGNGTPTPTISPTPTITPTPTPTVTPTPTPTPSQTPVPQVLPFGQNWNNTNLITTNGDWTNVPGIIGYRGDDLTGSTGTDPQTILADGATTPVDITANQINPDTITSGGIYEFEIADPTVAFQGSGTADAPHIVLNLNTTGSNNVTVYYNLRDIDGSADNAAQSVALQYRVGNSGDYTNVPAGFVADATTGPNEATKVTSVAAVLPANADNQPLVQVRVITANAVGSDEFVGIDDISVVSNGTVPLRGSGSASPNQVESGSSVLLTVAVSPATNPASTGITVSGNLSSIGGAATQTFFDDGTNGDQTPGDNTFSYSAQITADAFGGDRTVLVSIADAQSRTASASITFTVIAAASPQEHLTLGNPSGATTDINNPFNYLLAKPQYAVSYHRDRGIPNWVSWHLDSSWIGSAPRQDDFRPDPTLPDEWYHVTQFDYSGSGFDRGHHTPSGDRTRSIPDNSATFFMTNMMPQAPDNNQGPWEKLESDSRSIVGQGNELYIVGASVGTGGTGSNGGVTNTIADGKVTVPSYTWKVILILPVGDNDVARVNNDTRTIAVIMPNSQGIRGDQWQKYLATVDQVERLTGYDFFSNVPVEIQNVIEARLDSASNTSPQTVPAGTYANLEINSPNTTLTGNITITGNLDLGGSTLTTGANFCVTLGTNATVTRISGFVDGCVVKQFSAIAPPAAASREQKNVLSGIVPKFDLGGISEKTLAVSAPAAQQFIYPVGTMNGYSPLTVNVTAATANSSLAVTAVQGVQPNVGSPNLALRRYWTLTEAGDLTADLTFQYLDADVPVGINESDFKLQRYDGTFTEIPATIDPAANTAQTFGISQFSDWTLVAPAAPTASGVQIAGRVLSDRGRGVSRAAVVITNAAGEQRTALTNQFGYFRFEDIEAGQTYVVDVRHKRYIFVSQVVNVNENLTGLSFTAFPK